MARSAIFFGVRCTLTTTALTLTCFLHPFSVRAASFSVTNSSQLVTALDTASSNSENDTITLSGGTYSLNDGFVYSDSESDDDTFYNLIITGAGSGTTTITSTSAEGLTVSISGDLTVSGITFADSSESGLRVTQVQNLEVYDCEFSGNSESGLHMNIIELPYDGSASVHDNTFTENSSPNQGGGLFINVYSIDDFAFPITVEDNTFTSNSAVDIGGGAYLNNSSYDSDITARNNIFTNNQNTNEGGGGLYTGVNRDSSTILVEGNTFTGNRGARGAGLLSDTNSISDMIIRKNVFGGTGAGEGNTATGIEGGAGLYLWSAHNLTVSENSFIGNKAKDGYGGGLHVIFDTDESNSGEENIIYNTFENNRAEYGGGMYLASSCACYPTLHANAFLNNTATNAGGGVMAIVNSIGDTFKISNNVVARNESQNSDGAGLYLLFDSDYGFQFTNNTVAQNESENSESYGGGLFAEINNSGAHIDLINNLFWRNQAQLTEDAHFSVSEWAGLTLYNNIITDICVDAETTTCNDDSDFSTLFDTDAADNLVNQTQMFADTHGDAYGYRLLPDSPAIDAGTDTGTSSAFAMVDFDGDDRAYGDTTDCGAFETQADVGEDSVSYRYLKWSVLKRRGPDEDCAGTYCIQASEFTVMLDNKRVTWPVGTVATNPPGGESQNPSNERPENTVDLTRYTKWLDFYFNDEEGGAGLDGDVSTGQSDLIIDVGEGQTVTFDSYRWATANDIEDRDPVSWELYGSNDGSTWETLATVTDDEVKTAGVERYTSGVHYPINASTAAQAEVGPSEPQAKFNIEMTSSQSEPETGENVTFTLQITNNGDIQSTITNLELLASNGLVFVSASLDDATLDCTTEDASTDCDIGTFAIDEEKSVSATFLVNASGAQSLDAIVTGSSGNSASANQIIDANGTTSEGSGCSLQNNPTPGLNFICLIGFAIIPLILPRLRQSLKR